MAEKVKLTIVLRKEVDTQEQAQQIYNTVKTKLLDYPDVSISGQTNTKIIVATES